MKKYDTIIIGAGNGGLACACMLAKNGQKVLLLEQSHIPGGFATSFRRGRFEFELSLHELCTFGRDENHSGAVRQLFDYLEISDKIEWIDIPEAFRLITTVNGEKLDAEMPFGIDEFCEKADCYSPGCKKEMKRLFDLNEEMRLTLGELGKTKNKIAQLAVLLKKGGLLHTAAYSVDEVLAKVKMSEKAKTIFKAYWAYLCTDFSSLSFFHYLSMINSYVELGAVVPVNRSQEMTNCLVDTFVSNGGELWLNSKVVKINTEGSRCKSVVLNDGTVIEADNFVCNCSPHIAYGQLIEHKNIPEFEIRKANAQKFGGRGFCVFLGLNKSAEELGLKNYSYFIFPDMDTEKQFERMGHPETNDVQNTVCINAAYPSASPEGTCILCMTTLFTSDYWGSVTEENYYKEKENFANRMIETFEKATGTNIKDYIEEIEIATPETFARFTGTPQGTIYGYLGQKWDGVMPRTMMANKNDGFENLWFAGGYGERMLGFSSALASGRDTAKRICHRAVINGRDTV